MAVAYYYGNPAALSRINVNIRSLFEKSGDTFADQLADWDAIATPELEADLNQILSDWPAPAYAWPELDALDSGDSEYDASYTPPAGTLLSVLWMAKITELVQASKYASNIQNAASTLGESNLTRYEALLHDLRQGTKVIPGSSVSGARPSGLANTSRRLNMGAPGEDAEINQQGLFPRGMRYGAGGQRR